MLQRVSSRQSCQKQSVAQGSKPGLGSRRAKRRYLILIPQTLEFPPSIWTKVPTEEVDSTSSDPHPDPNALYNQTSGAAHLPSHWNEGKLLHPPLFVLYCWDYVCTGYGCNAIQVSTKRTTLCLTVPKCLIPSTEPGVMETTICLVHIPVFHERSGNQCNLCVSGRKVCALIFWRIPTQAGKTSKAKGRRFFRSTRRIATTINC